MRGFLLLISFLNAWSFGSDPYRDLDFLENFALAEDRAAQLFQLVPGSDQAFYYQCLLYQQQGRLKEAALLLDRWQKDRSRPGTHLLFNNMKLRQLLLNYDLDPAVSLPLLRDELDLSFTGRVSQAQNQTRLPSRIKPDQISWDSLKRKFLQDGNHWDNLTPEGLEQLWYEDLPNHLWGQLLDKSTRPDHPNLVKWVLWDLKKEGAASFGDRSIHTKMTGAQLAVCLKAFPELSQSNRFVFCWMRAMRNPEPVVTDGVFLAEAWAFLADLPSIHNWLKANILYHYLAWERQRGIYDKARFITYLKLPRDVAYMDADYLARYDGQHIYLDSAPNDDLEWDLDDELGFPELDSDQELVWDFLGHFLRGKADYLAFRPYVREDKLRRLFVAENLMAATGDPARLTARLGKDPEFLEELKKRVDIQLLPTNKTHFSPDELVRLDLNIKNVPTLRIKIYEINTANYYRTKGENIDIDIDLDGLVPGTQRKLAYQQGPLLRHEEHFEFPELKGRGVYVVEFIGNGKSSRALIYKGGFRTVVEPTRWGTSFTVFDEQNQLVRGARLYLGSHAFEAEPEGPILVPYGSKEKQEQAVIVHQHFATRVSFLNRVEEYRLRAGFYVNREALISGQQASLLVRPSCWIDSVRVPLSELEDPVLEIQYKDADDLTATQVIPGFALHEDKESVYSFPVPKNLRVLTFTLKARIGNHSKGEVLDLEASDVFTINGANDENAPGSFHLSQNSDGFTLFHLGQNGEPIADSPVIVSLLHDYIKDDLKFSLQTDELGRIELGRLAGFYILELNSQASGNTEFKRWWHLPTLKNQAPSSVHATLGEEIRITCPSLATRLADLSLLTWNGVAYRDEIPDKMRVEDGQVVITGLSPGLYHLFFKEIYSLTALRITEGQSQGGFIFSKEAILEEVDIDPLHISSTGIEGSQLVIQLRGAGPKTRVHVGGSYFAPAWQPQPLLTIHEVERVVLNQVFPRSYYTSGRDIGDEYRYILERVEGTHFPGNMLPKPGLLLNPWKRRVTQREDRSAEAGDTYARVGEEMDKDLDLAKLVVNASRTPPKDVTCLDFLAESAMTLINLKPNKDGRLTIPMSQLGKFSQIQVVAVDGALCRERQVILKEAKPAIRDLRLPSVLDPKQHYTRQKHTSALATGEALSVPEANLVKVTVIDHLDQVLNLLRGLNPDAWNDDFDFIRTWPDLPPEERLKKYSQFACHELNFFLYMKDRQFFDSTIKPTLAHKKDKTFLDHWLLQEDLSAYTEAWAHDRLNVVERILLGLHLSSEKQAQQQHIRDLFALLERDRQAADLDFQKVFASQSLSQDDWVIGIPNSPLEGHSAVGRVPKPESELAFDAEAVESRKPLDQVQIRLGKSKKQRVLFKMPELTQELAENNYYRLQPSDQGPERVTVNAFWADLSQAGKLDNFRSPHFPRASSNFTEVMLALAVFDLPFKAGQHRLERKDGTWSIQAASPLLLFHEEIRNSEAIKGTPSILMTQGLFKLSDRYRFDSGKRIEKLIDGELLTHTVYGCKVVLTNPTTMAQDLNVLIQLPQGALPLANGPTTRSLPIALESYKTETIEYLFYFPEPGSFSHYPATASTRDKVLAQATSQQLTVVHTPSSADTNSWDYLSRRGSAQQVLDFLAVHNVARLNLDLIKWRLNEKAFYEPLLAQLKTRRHYHADIWSYAFRHNDLPAMRTWLRHRKTLLGKVGPYLDCGLVSLNGLAPGDYEHLEYAPLINPRSHRLGKKLTIPDKRLSQQYRDLLGILSHKGKLDSKDFLAVSYYLLLQQRIDLALSTFAKVKRTDLATHLQYDYLQAYLFFYQGDLPKARSLAEAYQDYPLVHWRKRFAEVIAQLDEIDGGHARPIDGEQPDQALLAGKEPALELSVADNTLTLSYRNLNEVSVHYYLMDIEPLFSKRPFLSESGQQGFSMIKPNRTETISLPPDRETYQMQLPADLANTNVFVEVEAGAIRSAGVAMANTMNLHMGASYGQLQVMDRTDGRPMPRAYVKVYARLNNGEIVFYKDGYTDLRGRFDYISLSTDLLNRVDRLALLILSEDRGAQIREVQPPIR